MKLTKTTNGRTNRVKLITTMGKLHRDVKTNTVGPVGQTSIKMRRKPNVGLYERVISPAGRRVRPKHDSKTILNG